jgi:hypothetical protein
VAPLATPVVFEAMGVGVAVRLEKFDVFFSQKIYRFVGTVRVMAGTAMDITRVVTGKGVW